MKVLVVGVGGIGEVGAALVASLCRSGVTVMVAERVEPAPPDPRRVYAELLDAAMVRDCIEPSPPPQPYPVAKLRKIEISQVPRIGRTGKRQREQRTKRGR